MKNLLLSFLLVCINKIFSQQIPFTKSILLDSVALHPHIADINNDGHDDIVCVSNYIDEKETDANVKHLCWLEGPDWKMHSITHIIYRSCDLAVADIDADGMVDIIGSVDEDGKDTNGNEGLFYMKNIGSGANWKFNMIGLTPYTKDILVHDFNKDGKMDVAARSLHELTAGHGSHIDLFYQDKKGKFTKQQIETPPFDGTTLADINADGYTDIVINGAWLLNPRKINKKWKQYDYDQSWYNMNNNEGQTEWNHNNCRVAVGDMDGDKINDIVICSGETKGSPLVWYKGTEKPTSSNKWQKHVIEPILDYGHTLKLGDMDNDGDLDIVTGSLIFWDEAATPDKFPHNVTVYINYKNASSWKKQVIDIKGIYSGIIGDIDKDGDLDILGPRNYNLKSLYLLKNGLNNEIKYNGTVKISDDIDDGFDAFKIRTKKATYYLQKEAGGISSMYDEEGEDWIAWHEMGPDIYPPSLAGDFRGIPNSVWDGTTHPGFYNCISTKLNENTILCTSKNGKWKYQFEFYDDYVKLTYLQVDEATPFWFLYEGPIDGYYDPSTQFWGNNKDGLRSDKPMLHPDEGHVGNYDYIFFGGGKGKQILCLTPGEDDPNRTDLIAWADNNFEKATDGMMVFGFGRGKKSYKHFKQPVSFYFGFMDGNILDKNVNQKISEYIKRIKE